MESIYLTAMRTRYRQLTGSDPGQDSDIGIRLALLAGQLDLLEEELAAVRAAMDPETAAGAALDRHAAARGLTRKEAVAAAGSLTFYRGTAAAEAIRLPAGLTAAAGEDGPRFATTEAGVLAAGETEVTLPAAALAPGRAGNAAAGTVTALLAPVGGLDGVKNTAAFAGGQDAEDDESLRARLLESYRLVSNGANAAYYRRLALGLDGVTSVEVIRGPRGNGSLDLVIGGAGAVPPAETAAELEALLAGRREVGVDVKAFAAAAAPVPVTLTLWPGAQDSFDRVKPRVEAALARVFESLEVGEGLYTARLIGAVMAVPGVENCRLTAPAADVAAVSRTLVTLGSLTVTEGGAV